MKMPPETRTNIEKARPTSLVKVMSPNPSVDMTVKVQYTPVNQENSRPSRAMNTWKSRL